MPRIHILEEQVIRQIAAGEVVERPASVVKELLENSIDASSLRITLEISASGKELIRISDNGCGMTASDAVIALERHSTSKIQSTQDLDTLNTFGFRGEALPSISSISKMQLTTRCAEEPNGFSIEIEGGKILSQKECGRAVGTTIEIKDLFFNTPARLKFLKSDATERSKIIRTFEETAIAHPEIHFELKGVSSKQIQLPARSNTLERMTDLWGDSFSDQNLFPLSVQHPFIRIEGWISKPAFHQATKNYQVFYVNRRPIQSRSLTHALYEAFKDCLPAGRHPSAVIFVQLDPSQVDVNVHPSKREVRFRNESQIYETLLREIRFKRTQLSEAPKVFGGMEADRENLGATLEQSSQTDSLRLSFPSRQRREESRDFSTITPLDSPANTSWRGNDNQSVISSRPLPQEIPAYPLSSLLPRVLAQFDALYILAQKDSQLVIVDQHAAGERILYEKFKKALSAQEPVPVQALLFPIVWNVTLSQAELLKNHLETFQKIGFMLEAFGEKTFRLTESPAMITESDLKTTLEKILSAIENQTQPALVTEEILKQSACRAAVKANDILSHKELSELLTQLAKCDNPHTCPHGRPVTFILTRQELDKKFGRI